MKKKKALKGFTLIELIIVMAIFGILMAAVMQILDPLNKLAKRSSMQETNTAAVDNVKNYLEGSLRYADAIEVMVGALTDNDGIYLNDITKYNNLSKFFGRSCRVYPTKVGNHEAGWAEYSTGLTPITDGGGATAVEKAAVINFLDNHYANRVTEGEKPLTGNVMMLKIDNQNDGRITEFEWNFRAGYTYDEYYETEETDLDGNVHAAGSLKGTERVNACLINLDSPKVNTDVINPAYLQDYSFYISDGYNSMNTVFNTDDIATGTFDFTDDTADDYYAALEKVIDPNTVDETKPGSGVPYSFSKNMFSLSVITYKKDNPIGRLANDDSTTVDYNESLTKVFQSPFAITNVNMSLVNINSTFSSDKVYYGPVRKLDLSDSANPIEPDDLIENTTNKNWEYKKLGQLKDRLFVHQPVKEKNDDGTLNSDYHDVIYFIYTLPDFD